MVPVIEKHCCSSWARRSLKEIWGVLVERVPDDAEINMENQESPSFLNNSDRDMKATVQIIASKRYGF